MNTTKKTQQKNKKNTGGGIIFASLYSYFIMFFMIYIFYQVFWLDNSDFKYYTNLVLEKDNFKFLLIALAFSYILVILI